MPALAHHMRGDRACRLAAPGIDQEVAAELDRLVGDKMETPESLLLLEATRARWTKLADRIDASGGVTGAGRMRIAYSVKTNPDRRLLALGRDLGFLAEAISQHELEAAIDSGFAPEQVVLNGPAKHWPEKDIRPTFARFGDSVPELRQLLADGMATHIGPRLRLPIAPSRFGINVGDFESYRDLVTVIGEAGTDHVGIHFHYAASDLGWHQWRAAIETFVDFAVAVESASGNTVTCVDLGGGWAPDDWEDVFLPTVAEVVRAISRRLTDLALIIVEPGKALAQPAGVIVTRVIEVRGAHEAVVDASIAELPDAMSHPHRVLRRSGDTWKPLETGEGQLLGRLCMERDIVARGVSLDRVSEGELLVIADAGAYDRSMGYSFGRG
jgi:diaminopimelate decarboxylase